MILYDYFRSSASYRVRIALNLKKLSYEKKEVHLRKGEQHESSYQALNPQELVPSLKVNGQTLHQSLAIIDYLDETYPQYPLLPKDPLIKAYLRSLALLIACDIHPLNNLRVLKHLELQFKAEEQQIQAWYHHWLKAGFDAFEQNLKTVKRTHPLCWGEHPSLADLCLIPQVYNAARFQFPMKAYPLIREINDYCLTLDAFKNAAPG